MSSIRYASTFQGIDLSSDTVTRPTMSMKKAMMDAPLGDEQKGEDPTTRQLEELMAELLGFDAAIFLPSATMANQIAIQLHCQPGDELIAAENSHIFIAESGGTAIHARVMSRCIPTQTGIFSGDHVFKAHHESPLLHHTHSSCLAIENTTNYGGGLAWDLTSLHSALDAAKSLKLKTHLDGARLFNSAIKLDISPKKLSSPFDSVTICLSKGLGCPIGAILAIRKPNLDKALRCKHLLGGAMRQSGILAAAGIYALEHHVSRLAEDHSNATLLAEKIESEIPEIHIEKNQNSTNMVFFEWRGTNITSTEFYQACLEKGVRFSKVRENRFRMVTHLDISRDNINTVLKIFKQLQSQPTQSIQIT